MSVGLLGHRQPAVRAPINPMDKSTVVSIYPFRIIERKATIHPGRFIIEPGSYDNPSLLVVGTSSWWREIDETQPLLEITNSSIQVADSIVRDYCNGLFACNMGDKMPGLFWIPGEIEIVAVKIKYKHLLDLANANQTRYFEELVKQADVLWARTNANPLAISDDMKVAAQELGLKEKSWLKDYIAITEMSSCPACGFLRNNRFPVCHNCKVVVDKEAFNTLGLPYAQ